jgi:hypothetical protein
MEVASNYQNVAFQLIRAMYIIYVYIHIFMFL